MLRQPKYLLPDIKLITRLLKDPKLSQSYYPSEQRKSKTRIALDLLWWYLLHGEVNEYYYLYGFDRKCSRTSDYFAYPRFRAIRDGRNRHPVANRRFDYVCILQDKFVFSSFLASLGFPTPEAIALCTSDWMVWLDSMESGPTTKLLADDTRQFDGFCKPLFGINGRDAFPLRMSQGLLYRDAQPISAADVITKPNERYLIQRRIKQHPTMSKLHAESLNTIRIITFNNAGKIHVFSAAQRIGTRGRSVDNWTAGGILVGVDLVSGKLRPEGFYKPGYGGIMTEHPQTRVVFSDFTVPYFFDAIRLVSKVHQYLPGIHSIGWDVAISESCPVIIEGNDDWDGAVPMAIEKNFRRRFLEMYNHS